VPHGEIDEIFPDVFLVRGTFRAGPGISFGRNMVVLREGDALTLANSVRLSPEGERALERLGTVRHLSPPRALPHPRRPLFPIPVFAHLLDLAPGRCLHRAPRRWLREMTGGRPQALRPDFEQLVSQDFAHLVSAYGKVLRDTARAELKRSCAAVLGME